MPSNLYLIVRIFFKHLPVSIRDAQRILACELPFEGVFFFTYAQYR